MCAADDLSPSSVRSKRTAEKNGMLYLVLFVGAYDM